MDGASDQVLAGPGLSHDQDSGVGGRDTVEAIKHLLERGGMADDSFGASWHIVNSSVSTASSRVTPIYLARKARLPRCSS
jgi:hypothetical protein